MIQAVKERIAILQEERQKLAERLSQLTAERERTAHLISAYDGALGELSGLLQTAAPEDDNDTPEA